MLAFSHSVSYYLCARSCAKCYTHLSHSSTHSSTHLSHCNPRKKGGFHFRDGKSESWEKLANLAGKQSQVRNQVESKCPLPTTILTWLPVPRPPSASPAVLKTHLLWEGHLLGCLDHSAKHMFFFTFVNFLRVKTESCS